MPRSGLATSCELGLTMNHSVPKRSRKPLKSGSSVFMSSGTWLWWLAIASIFVDSRESTLDDIGEIAVPIEKGVITEQDILADHFQLARGKHSGRASDDEITLFKNGGGGHLDLMTARFVAEG